MPCVPQPADPICYNTRVGTLYLVATPIGNLEDVTLRALRVLGEVNLIAAEDTRQTRKLLSRYQIGGPVISYHEHSKQVRLERLIEALDRGDVALVSDAGTPGLSDPGYELVRAALEAGHKVTPIPGPSAPIAALVASGLPTETFVFLGYLPRRGPERQRLLRSLSSEGRTMLAFEVPHRLRQTLADLEHAFGGERPVAIARELTKVHEEVLRGTLRSAREEFSGRAPRGEFTLVIGGAKAGGRWSEDAVRAALSERIGTGDTPSAAARQVAELCGWPRREVYRLAMEAR